MVTRRMRGCQAAAAGFTLVELMIVMVVIAVLIAVLLPTFQSFRRDAQIQKVWTDLNSLKAAVEAYYQRVGSYPVNITGAAVGSLPANDFFANQRVVASVLADPFQIDTSPATLPTPAPATYRYFSAGNDYFIYSNGGLSVFPPTAAGCLRFNAASGRLDQYDGSSGSWRIVVRRVLVPPPPHLILITASISQPFPYVTNLE